LFLGIALGSDLAGEGRASRPLLEKKCVQNVKMSVGARVPTVHHPACGSSGGPRGRAVETSRKKELSKENQTKGGVNLGPSTESTSPSRTVTAHNLVGRSLKYRLRSGVRTGKQVAGEFTGTHSDAIARLKLRGSRGRGRGGG